MNQPTNSTEHDFVGPERISIQASRRKRRPLRRSCLISVLVIAAIIGVPAYWWMSSYAPVTLFPVQGTLDVTSYRGECGKWDTTVWPPSSSFSAAEAVDASSEKDLWIGTGAGNILRGDGQNWQHVQTLKTADAKQVRVRQIDVHTDNDVWVVGEYQAESHNPNSMEAYAEPWRSAVFHWDGKNFEHVTVSGADPLASRGVLPVESMAAIAVDDAWFVGSVGRIWHWNGKEIAAVEPADLDIKRFDLNSI